MHLVKDRMITSIIAVYWESAEMFVIREIGETEMSSKPEFPKTVFKLVMTMPNE